MVKIEMEPVGFVKENTFESEVLNEAKVSEIIIQNDLKAALDGIRDFSHLFIIFWMNRIPKDKRRRLKVHPRGRKDLPLLGVFATRTPYRANPIGLTLVELLKVQNNVLTVRGLDALDGTPILDIKPFDLWDMRENVKVPKWWIKMEKDRTTKSQANDTK